MSSISRERPHFGQFAKDVTHNRCYSVLFFAFAAVALYWLAFGGLDQAVPAKATNDLHDVEYAILGSLSVGLLSNDKRLSTICRAMAASARGRHVWFHESNLSI